jgi:nucleoside-diphosphate-sugar epimerase
MAKILVTGAEGFTGQYMTARLVADGHEVHGLMHKIPPAGSVADDRARGLAGVHACDLSDVAAVQRVVQVVSPEMVVHLAGIAFVAHENVEAVYRTNIVGTRNLLAALAAAPSRPRAVLLAGSANIYGNATEGMLDESTPPAPANDYAVSKLAMEYMASLYRDQLPIVITRPFNYTGVGQDENFLLPKIVAHVRRGAAVIELGNLDVARDFSDVRFVVDAYARLLACPGAVGQAFNICSGQAHTLNALLHMVREISGHTFEVRVNPAFVRGTEVKTLLGSRARLDACIGPTSTISLHDTLSWMLTA